MVLPSDADCVNQARGGDPNAYKDLVVRYQGHVYGLAYSLCGNWADAQDIAQETFIRAYMNLDQLEIPDFQPGPAETVEKRGLAEAVFRALSTLPPKYRLPLTMFHLDGLSYQKVADFLDIPLGTAKSLIHTAQKKLRTALATYAGDTLAPVVQEVFNEHKLPPEFAQKIINGVPSLAWGIGKECTFAGALEAATAVTQRSCKYSDLMGWSGLAFRVRWYRSRTGQRWCGSSAVGEMPEERDLLSQITGWNLVMCVQLGEKNPDMERFLPRIIASIDAGVPVAAYGYCLDMSVIYGYEEGGKVLLLRDYHKGDTFKLPIAKLGPLQTFLEHKGNPMPPREALLLSLRTVVTNWNRVLGDGGNSGRGYHYGRSGFTAWIGDLDRFDEVDAKDKELLFQVSHWNFRSLLDARKAGVTFLREHADILEEPARSDLLHAADIYQEAIDRYTPPYEAKKIFLCPWSGDPIDRWTREVREDEKGVLRQILSMEENAMEFIERGLKSIHG